MRHEKRPHPDDVRAAVARGIPKAEIARRAGVHENTLTKVESADWNPKYQTLKTICNAIAEIEKES